MRWLVLAAASTVVFTATTLSTYVPFRDAAGIEYVFVWPGAARLLVGAAIALAVLAVAFLLTLVGTRLWRPVSLPAVRAGRWLAPLAWLGVVVIGILPAVPGVGQYGAPAGYLFYDLRWWWLGLLVVAALARFDRALADPIRGQVQALWSWAPAPRRLLLDGVLFAGVIAWAWATTPNLRFSQLVSGDEPKYLRYCEVWYQGQGFVIETKRYLSELPLDGPSAVLRNFALLPGALAEEARALAVDLRSAASDPLGFKWNRAVGAKGFLSGKHGGVYQIHQPGLSLVVFPGYFLDRYLLSLTPGYNGEIPADLMMTRVTLLLIYGACGVALFRLLSRALQSEPLAWIWAAAGTLMLPMTAFAMQFYPELPALLIVLLVTNFVLFHARGRGWMAAAFAGAGAAALSWFHPRFLLLTACLAVIGLVRTTGRTRHAFAAGCGLVLFSLGLFDYRISGSWLPNALWASQPGPSALAASRLWPNLTGYAVNRMWGLAPHAPLLLGVLPGLLVLGRQSVRRAAFIAVAVLALAVPSAGHTLSAAGTTPGRLVVAVVPLLLWPVAVLVRRFWSSMTVRALVALAAVLTLDAALAYNRTFDSGFAALKDTSVSGWKINLAFPLVFGNSPADAAPGNVALTWMVVAVAIAVSLAAYLRSRQPPEHDDRSQRWTWLVPAGVVASFVLLSTAATSAVGGWARHDYLMNDAVARRAATEALVAQDRCRVCFTSRRRQVDWTWLQPNTIQDLKLTIDFDYRKVFVHLGLKSAGPSGGFGRVRLDFGDGSGTDWQGIIEPFTVTHAYARGGQFRIDAWLQLPSGERRVTRTLVHFD